MPGAPGRRAAAHGGPLDGYVRTWPTGHFVFLDDDGRMSGRARHLYIWIDGRWTYATDTHVICKGCGVIHVRPLFPDTPCDLCGGEL